MLVQFEVGGNFAVLGAPSTRKASAIVSACPLTE